MKNFIIPISVVLLGFLHAECYELDYSDCLYWSYYCEWNDDAEVCQEIGGGTGGGTGGAGDGPYEFSTINESQGLRNGPDYKDGVLYYPLDADPPYKSIVLSPGFGSGSSSMSSWAEFYASHGFMAMTVGPNDEIYDSHQQRGEGLLDGIESIRQENTRMGSPVFGLIDLDNFSVSGYSMGGGASQNAAMMDNSIKAVISLNPTVLFDDCDLCPGEDFDGVTYCICLVPELIDHAIPSLIFAGEVEINELPDYEGMLGQDIYTNMSENTDKILFEGAGDGHGFAAFPYGEVAEYSLNWLKYYFLDDAISCETLLNTPASASQYLINLDCYEAIIGDLNNDGFVDILDIISLVNLILNEERK